MNFQLPLFVTAADHNFYPEGMEKLQLKEQIKDFHITFSKDKCDRPTLSFIGIFYWYCFIIPSWQNI